MTMPSEPPHDPTMEEILASIRKIISEDQPASAKPKGQDIKPGNGPGDILELTDEIPEEATGIPRTAAPGEWLRAPDAPQADKRDPVLSDTSRQAIGRAFETLDKASEQYSAFAGGMLETVFSRAVQESVAPSLQAWVSSHETQLLEALKPIMREWMDANLPRMVESVLKQELGRAVTEHLRSRLG